MQNRNTKTAITVFTTLVVEPYDQNAKRTAADGAELVKMTNNARDALVLVNTAKTVPGVGKLIERCASDWKSQK